MPVYRYECRKCNLSFDKLVIQSNQSSTTCENCGDTAEKIVARTNMSFKSTRPQGETGIHDVDYPVVDKAVGRSAETRWQGFNARKETEAKAREAYDTKSLGKFPVSDDTDEYYKVAAKRIEYRRNVINEYGKIVSEQNQ
jgi:putative FmdB family regulatory protein